MRKRGVLEVLAERNDEWIYMAQSFGLSKDDANETVQGMYLKMHAYVKDVDKIMYNETEVNTFYVYRTLQNLFKSRYHSTGKKSGVAGAKEVPCGDLFDSWNVNDDDNDTQRVESDTVKAISRYYVESSETIDQSERLKESMYMFDSLFGVIDEDVKGIVDKWYWYDRKLFRLYYDNNMSMRQISKATGISLKSVFNSLKIAKSKLRDELQEDYDNYKKSLEE